MASTCVVVGGGVSGLTTAIALAKRGASVQLIEKTRELGGRAATQDVDGFRMNLGPHALYRNGIAGRTLRSWGIELAGRKNSVSRKAYAIRDGKRHKFPHNFPALMTTGALSLAERMHATKALARMSGNAWKSARGSVRQWIDGQVPEGGARLLVEALIRVSTYAAALDELDAAGALHQVKLAFDGGVIYLDSGWQSMVNALAVCAERHGVLITRGTVVERVAQGLVELSRGERVDASTVILAVPPKEATRLTGVAVTVPVPVEAACLDLGMSRLPDDAASFALGMDTPFYFSVHSDTAAGLAPPGGAMVHVAKYLMNGESVRREDLEGFADIAMPGWRPLVGASRFMPGLTVANAILHPSGRPGAGALGLPGVLLAGDWVGSEGMLVDAAVASGLRAAGLASLARTAAA